MQQLQQVSSCQALTLADVSILQDGMVYHHEVLEHGDFGSRQQVVRWLRRFPFAFLSDRDYCIARREFKEADGSIYGITKVRCMAAVNAVSELLLALG
jgi:hypothetical protein